MNPALRQGGAYLFERDISALVQQREDRIGMLFNPVGGPVATLGFRARIAALAPSLIPADNTRRTDAKTVCGGPAAQSLINRSESPNPQINRKRLTHDRLASFTSPQGESESASLVNPK